jgi:hypothetical protein
MAVVFGSSLKSLVLDNFNGLVLCFVVGQGRVMRQKDTSTLLEQCGDRVWNDFPDVQVAFFISARFCLKR